MKLQTLMQRIGMMNVSHGQQEITGLAYHTRQVKPGALFVAIAGTAADGHAFVPQAIAAGAVAVVTAHPVVVPDGVANVVVPNPRAALAQLSAQWYGEPSRRMRLVGVTGTNGKTTITYLLESIWCAAHRRPGVIGTVSIRYADVTQSRESDCARGSGLASPNVARGRGSGGGAPDVIAPTTTPESLDLQGMLKRMLDAATDDVVMEVSSHALDQGRVLGCHFDGAIFTNLTQDHLDYHLTMDQYGAAKRRLFTEILPASAKQQPWAVINADDPAGALMADGCPVRTVRYSLFGTTASSVVSRQSSGTAVTDDRRPMTDDGVFAADVQCTIDGIRMEIVTPTERYAVQSALRGRFNASNILAAAAAAYAMGLPTSVIQEGMRLCAMVPGRLEAVPNTTGVTVLVDYAHTPDALRNILAALRELRPARLITVFGCGGDRDPGKRPLMGAEVGRVSDVAFVTSDNPRTEDPHAIIAQILPGLKACDWKEVAEPGAAKTFRVIVDRKQAIEEALRTAQRGDIVVIAGKGHEDYQIIGTEKRHFDDREVVKEFFRA